MWWSEEDTCRKRRRIAAIKSQYYYPNEKLFFYSIFNSIQFNKQITDCFLVKSKINKVPINQIGGLASHWDIHMRPIHWKREREREKKNNTLTQCQSGTQHTTPHTWSNKSPNLGLGRYGSGRDWEGCHRRTALLSTCKKDTFNGTAGEQQTKMIH